MKLNEETCCAPRIMGFRAGFGSDGGGGVRGGGEGGGTETKD